MKNDFKETRIILKFMIQKINLNIMIMMHNPVLKLVFQLLINKVRKIHIKKMK